MSSGNKIIVQKYGGATVASPEKIKAVALRLAALHRQGFQVVAVVSAMGKTTNQLIDLAHQISEHPHRREMDMLLTTGERVCMALVTMALHDLGIQAISFTGSQAGILTDESHFNAQIQDVKAFRVTEALNAGKVVVLAGFQGVSPISKDITTLGRGGSDSTAVAMAAYLQAQHCEILKEVPAVFTADPQLVKTAKIIPHLNYEQMLDMTFWGAKVLYYRSVELARAKKVRLYIGPAARQTEEGTWIDDVSSTQSLQAARPLLKANSLLAINSHEKVLELSSQEKNPERAVQVLNHFLESHEIAPPQVLHSTAVATDSGILIDSEISADSKISTDSGISADSAIADGQLRLFITGPQEIILAVKKEILQCSNFELALNNLSSVTVTGAGLCYPERATEILTLLRSSHFHLHYVLQSPLSTTVFLDHKDRERAIELLHSALI